MRPRVTPCRLNAALISASFVLAPGVGASTYADIAPLITERCVPCHSGSAAPLGLRLDSLQAIERGSDRGPIVVKGDPAGSELIRRLKGTSTPRMPMTGPPFFTPEEIARFEAWIANGLPPGDASPAAATPRPTRPAPGEMVSYAHVAPILLQRCAKCHTTNGLVGSAPEGYHLTSYEATLSPSDRVRVVPGQPAASELMRRIRGTSLSRMPFDGPPYLSDEDQQLIEDWIAQGARDATGKPAPIPVGARVRLQGTLSAHWVIDGFAPLVTSSTRIDKSPRPGDIVEMRGRIAPDGRVIAERIRRR